MQTLDSYLVELGFKIDHTSLRRWEDALNRLSETVEKHTSNPLTGIGGMFVKTGGMILGTLGALEGAVAGVAFHTANMDLNMQIAARRMFMDVGKFRDMKTALDALGVSMEDVMFGPPELRERYKQLMEDSARNPLGTDWEIQMRRMRDVEFQLLRIKNTFESRFIPLFVGDLSKQLFGDQGDLERNLEMFNTQFIDKLPEWSDQLARVVAPALRMTGDALKWIWEMGSGAASILGGITGYVHPPGTVPGEKAYEHPNAEAGRAFIHGVLKGEPKDSWWSKQLGTIDAFLRGWEKDPKMSYKDIARAVADRYHIDPDRFMALIQAESNWNPTAKNLDTGAYGFGQFMPGNMHMYGMDASVPAQNLDMAGHYLSDLLSKYKGDWNKALTEYGGFKTADPSAYIDSITGARKAQPISFHTTVNVHVDGSTGADEIGHVVAQKVAEENAKTSQRLLIEMGSVYA